MFVTRLALLLSVSLPYARTYVAAGPFYCLNLPWPYNHRREIARSAWPSAAERLLEHGVRILDGAGVAWRPRLKTAQAQQPRKRRTKAAQDDQAESDAERPSKRARRTKRQRINYDELFGDPGEDEDSDYAMLDMGWWC
jgi:hypothetical protein